MGAYLSEPMTNKESENGEGNKVKYGACSMQGWRVTQEDAHNCIASFDEKSSLFAVYDGHGGSEVAAYLSQYLPDVLKNCDAYKNGEFVKALKDCFLQIDESIKTPEVIKVIRQLAKRNNEDGEATVDYEEENVGALYEEATMPLDKLVAKYQSGEESNAEAEDPDCKPGSSKSVATTSPSSSKSAEVGQSASSAGGSSSSSAPSSMKENGDGQSAAGSNSANETASSEPNKSEEVSSTTGSDEKTKTDENGSSSIESSKDLVIEGQKIELKSKEDDAILSGKKNIIPEENTVPAKAINGNSSSGDDEKVEGDDAKEDKEQVAAVNGAADSSTEKIPEAKSEVQNSADSSTPETPRRKKVHPVPVMIENMPERRSPRKSQANKSFECSDSDDSEDDEDAGYSNSESDDMEDEEGNEEDSSSASEDGYNDDEDEEDDRFLSDVQEPGYDSGCTAVVGYMKWEADGLSLWVANVGDSRCVVCREGKAIDMSHDHKPESEEEARRIINAGGKVTDDGRVNGGLNLSRAIGDHSYKQNTDLPPEEQMISPVPTIEHIMLNPTKDKFVVLACDGIWNSMTSQEVVDFVSVRMEKNEPLSQICGELFDNCLAPDTRGDGTGCDNMTAIIVKISDAPEAFSGSKRKFSEDNDGTESSYNEEAAKKSRVE